MELMPRVSVLMSVYKNDNPLFLKQALQSLVNQTYQVEQYVIVKDGPVTNDIEKVLQNFKQNNRHVEIIGLDRNRGLADALQVGLEAVRNEIVVRMDSDDVSLETRIEQQMHEMLHDSQVAVISSNITEFSDDVSDLQSSRVLPSSHQDLVKFAQWRNPVNHPSVMFRKSAVLKVGGYKTFDKFEDYHLWVRMIVAGFKFVNIQESLVFMRTGNGLYNRRGGWRYLVKYVELRQLFIQWGFSTHLQGLIAVLSMTGNVLLPPKPRELLYNFFLRKK